jgi:hypothetical protein
MQNLIYVTIIMWDDAIYICRHNHLPNCSITFITIAQHTQMYWNNRMALAEDNTETPWTLYWSATRKLQLSSQSQSHMATDGQSSKVKVKVTLRLTVRQSVSLGVEPHLELMTRYLVLFDSYGLVFFLWGALSDERAGLSFVRVTACISKSFVIM